MKICYQTIEAFQTFFCFIALAIWECYWILQLLLSRTFKKKIAIKIVSPSTNLKVVLGSLYGGDYGVFIVTANNFGNLKRAENSK